MASSLQILTSSLNRTYVELRHSRRYSKWCFLRASQSYLCGIRTSRPFSHWYTPSVSQASLCGIKTSPCLLLLSLLTVLSIVAIGGYGCAFGAGFGAVFYA